MRDLDKDPEGKSGLALLRETREQLLSELGKLTDKRKDLEARLEALGEELKGVDVEVEATRRMLGLVEATEQQLAGQEEAIADEPPTSVEAGTEVRGEAVATSAVLA
jgi:chromosome segregation ATPase